MITYVLILSQTFPANHPKEGQLTRFADKLQSGEKLHTIRANYHLWHKRFENIEKGEACLSVRQWTGKPYRSKMVEIARLTKDDGIGIQCVAFYKQADLFERCNIKYAAPPKLNILAKNDGLSFKDWKDWFRNYDLSNPLAIIHFTKFRY